MRGGFDQNPKNGYDTSIFDSEIILKLKFIMGILSNSELGTLQRRHRLNQEKFELVVGHAMGGNMLGTCWPSEVCRKKIK